ncbi:MAG TPA: hypothetical protein VEW25_02725 [Allosphingosinicella sp.]|nr:hypothetical protein [Allosphingosinicella sp.]
MRLLILAAGLAAIAIPATASAHPHHNRYGYNESETARELRECRREIRRADSRREHRAEVRECRRELRDARWDDRRRGYRSSYHYARPRYGNAWGTRGRYWDGYRWRYRR